MKLSNLRIILFFIASTLYPQEIMMEIEISLGTEGLPNPVYITYTLEGYGTIWANDQITNGYRIAEEVIWGNHEAGDNNRGYVMFWEPIPGYEEFAHGMYKFSNDYNSGSNYFFLDLRDCQFANQSYGEEGYETDFLIKYNTLNDLFQYADQLGSWYNLPNGVVLPIWEIKNGLPITSCFNSFWQNSLVIGLHLYRNPQIIWGRNPDQYFIQQYYLYRKINNGSWYRIGVFNSQTFNYEDKSIKYNDNYFNTASYRVTSYNGTESGYTNTETVIYSEFDWNNGLILSKNGNHPRLVWVPYQDDNFNVTNYNLN